MNMKRINEVPVIEELGENSYVLVDNDGTAARIAGSKVGGGGGASVGDMLWGFWNDDESYCSVCRENDISTIVDYETGSKYMLSNGNLLFEYEGYIGVEPPMGIFYFRDDLKMLAGNLNADFGYIFSDTKLPEAGE